MGEGESAVTTDLRELLREGLQGQWPCVQWFANEMQRELHANNHKTGWDNLSQKWLLNRLKQEVGELERAVESGKNIVSEAADVANFAMMIADKSQEQVDD